MNASQEKQKLLQCPESGIRAGTAPGIAQRIYDHLTEFTGREVRVRVGFIEAQQTT
jgi:hypothetical protein